MLVSDLDFELPEELIAQSPVSPRDASRLLAIDRSTGAVDHGSFGDILHILRAGDVVVLNDTKVAPVRLPGRKPTGGKAEILLVRPAAGGEWEALVKGVGEGRVLFDGIDGDARVRRGPGGRALVRFSCPVGTVVERVGRVPLPPYIRRSDDERDRDRYQTVYARHAGAVAAPTAGLHFTESLLAGLAVRGVEVVTITLHVGPGTFLPMRTERVSDHEMDEESFEVPEKTAESISAARSEGRRVVAVGTTVTRTLESLPVEGGRVLPDTGATGIFISPGYRFRLVDGIITNFHLPRSTPLFLAAAFAGSERILRAYREAIAKGYRFYSYGDAMVIL